MKRQEMSILKNPRQRSLGAGWCSLTVWAEQDQVLSVLRDALVWK